MPDMPNWLREYLPNAKDLWAPDISLHNGVYYLYYAGSHFGTNTSVIGLATNTTLNPADKNYRWVDQGLVIGSTSANNYNTIDPNLKPMKQRMFDLGWDHSFSSHLIGTFRYTNRRLVRTIEDVGTLGPAGEIYYIANPGFPPNEYSLLQNPRLFSH